jgi:hypothetical protein
MLVSEQVIVDAFINGQSAALSVFSVDPGDSSGWCWILISKKEYLKYGLKGSLERAKAHELPAGNGPTGGTWRRFQQGTVSCNNAVGGVRELIGIMAVCSLHAYHIAPNIKNDEMICLIEDFTLRKMSSDKSLLSPVVIGSMLQMACNYSSLNVGIKRFSSSDAKTTNTDARLKGLGMYEAHSRHSRDAIRHMILFLKKIGN